MTDSENKNNSVEESKKPFSMMFPEGNIALDVPEHKMMDFFDDFIAMNWCGGDAEEFIEEYGDGFRPMSKEEKEEFKSHSEKNE